MNTKSKKLLTLLSVIMMLAVFVPTALAAPPAQEGGQDYVIVADDWLSKLAEKYLGNLYAYPAIVEYTNRKNAEDASYAKITDPDLIEVGWKIYIPSAEEATQFLVEAPAAAPPEEQVLYIMGDERSTLDLTYSVYKHNWGAALITEPMVRINKDFDHLPGSGGAESWEVADDNVTWTIHLFPDLQWSDGTPLTAHDYVWSLKRMADPETGYDVAFNFYEVLNFKNANKGEVSVDDIGVRAIDDHTIEVKSERPVPYFFRLWNEWWVAPRHVIEEVGEGWSLDPKTSVSSGPYKLEEWEKGRELVFVRNTAYKGPQKPYLEKIVYKIGGPEALFPAYEVGENEAIYEDYEGVVSVADRKLMEAQHPEEIHSYQKMQTFCLTWGYKNTVFSDPKVRQAFMHAIDREALVKGPLAGIAVPAYQWLPKGFHCANPDRVKDIQKYDPDLARKLLAEAGYPNGEGFPEYTIALRAASPSVEAAAEAIQAMLKDNLGITVKIENMERKIFSDKLVADELDLDLIPWGMDYFDASNFANVFTTGFRHPWSNAEYDALVQEANSTVGDEEQRCELYQQASEVLCSDPGAVFLWHPLIPQAWKAYIHGSGVEPNKYGDAIWWRDKKGDTVLNIYIGKDK